VHLCLGVPSYPMRHQQRFACYVLNTLLGGGMSSRLFQNIRERQGLAYAVFSELSPYRDTGCLSVYAGTSIESALKVVHAVTGEFRLLKEELVGEEELRRAKDHLKGSLVLGLESTGSRMSNLARQEMYFGRFFSLDELVESIEAVSAGEIREIARRSSTPDRSPSRCWATWIVSRLAGKTWSAEYLRLEHRQAGLGVAPGARSEHALARERLPETLGGPRMVQCHLRQQEPGLAAQLEVGAMNAQANCSIRRMRRNGVSTETSTSIGPGPRRPAGSADLPAPPPAPDRRLLRPAASGLTVAQATEQFFALVQAYETAAACL